MKQCPYCKKDLNVSPAELLLKYLRTHQQQCEQRAATYKESDNERIKHRSLAIAKSAQKWQAWADFVERSIKKEQ
ncbi:hypothetical protein LCGC14_2469010 [marine sediment metagenome]|uniref:Uncharacterized protein n=1 Tax=marine sediment metagenome TaxID=412755 RepID=A0A0F9BAW1_9ZZZZ